MPKTPRLQLDRQRDWTKHALLDPIKGPLIRARRNVARRKWRLNRPKQYLLTKARERARAAGVLFQLCEADFSIPSTCPVLGIPLLPGVRRATDNSPTIDRIRPDEGYHPTNVAVISHKANRLKSDATVSELRAVLRWLELQ